MFSVVTRAPKTTPTYRRFSPDHQIVRFRFGERHVRYSAVFLHEQNEINSLIKGTSPLKLLSWRLAVGLVSERRVFESLLLLDSFLFRRWTSIYLCGPKVMVCGHLSCHSHFSVSLFVRDKFTRQCPQTTTWQRRVEAESNREPSACQPNALPLGQTGSLFVDLMFTF